MSNDSVGSVSAQGGVDQFIRQVMSAVDTNHDGQLSTSEFTALLEKFVSPGTGRTTGASVSDAGPVDPIDPRATEIQPSTWTDNNAPYGITFAGFSPQNHTDLSLADLSKPQNAKYAAYDYLLSNQIMADNAWAPAAAEGLNRRYGTTLFTAIDGETLGYGDEYIHSAPNGYGMVASTYNPNAKGEFFWGAES